MFWDDDDDAPTLALPGIDKAAAAGIDEGDDEDAATLQFGFGQTGEPLSGAARACEDDEATLQFGFAPAAVGPSGPKVDTADPLQSKVSVAATDHQVPTSRRKLPWTATRADGEISIGTVTPSAHVSGEKQDLGEQKLPPLPPPDAPPPKSMKLAPSVEPYLSSSSAAPQSTVDKMRTTNNDGPPLPPPLDAPPSPSREALSEVAKTETAKVILTSEQSVLINESAFAGQSCSTAPDSAAGSGLENGGSHKRAANIELPPARPAKCHRRNGEASDSSGSAMYGNTYSWEFSVRNGFEAFHIECQAIVESLYQAFLVGGPATAPIATPQGHKVVLDFAQMQQRLESSTRKRGLRRRTLSGAGGEAEVASRGGSSSSSVPATRAFEDDGVATGYRNSKRTEKIVWEFSVKDGFKAFPAECQDDVEKQFQAFRAGGSSAGRVKITHGQAVIVDFLSMKQRSEGPGRERSIRRTTAHG